MLASVQNGVDTITDGKQAKPFINAEGCVDGLRVHEGNIYLLFKDQLFIYDQKGTPTSSWPTHKPAHSLAIHNRRIYIPDNCNNRVTVYSMGGKVRRQIECPLNENCDAVICVTSKNYIVISLSNVGVICIKIDVGKTLWTNNMLDEPYGAISDSRGYLYVATGGCTVNIQIAVLSQDTGMFSD